MSSGNIAVGGLATDLNIEKENATKLTLAAGVELGVHVMKELIGTQISNIPYEDTAELMGAVIQKELGV